MSINHKKYTLVIVDEHSRYTWVYFLRKKSKAPEVIMSFIRMVENQNDVKVKQIRIDNGTKFRNHELESFYDEKGISLNFSSPYTPEQNGVAERKNITLTEADRTMLNGLNDQMITQPTDAPSGNNTEGFGSIIKPLVHDVTQSHISNQASISSHLAPQDRWSKYQYIELVNIIGNPSEGMLTRSMASKLTAASASKCLFAVFLSEIEPKKSAKKQQSVVVSSAEAENVTAAREFWSTVVAFDPFLSTDEPEKRPLKEFLIKFSILNGQKPLTLTPFVHQLALIIIMVLGRNYSSTEHVNSIQQLLAYSLIIGTEDPSKVTVIELMVHLIAINNRRDSMSPPPLAAKPNKRKSQTVTSTLPRSQGPKASRGLSKKSKRPKSKQPLTKTKRDIQVTSTGLPSTLDDGTCKSKPLPESTPTHLKDLGGNKQPLNMDLTSTTSDKGMAKTTPRTGAKYQDELEKESDAEEVIATGDDIDKDPQDDAEYLRKMSRVSLIKSLRNNENNMKKQHHGSANVEGENTTNTATEEPPSHTEEETEDPKMAILISSI
uniref:Retrovirus-related Pol polyprotein from transposon TNT 1-94 n=1 Tax=Tanacetum cinerariifolium TaxID=118510 RepID=A0A6L2JN43_TANCI|nr:retrovirus-related Pol polyprotein from transposon TNT 1-94 [Tanacetum cinerariifolium]